MDQPGNIENELPEKEQSENNEGVPSNAPLGSTENSGENSSEQTTSNPQIGNMEVHKHPHHVTHEKKWKEYMLEFFMIFVAVFCGFFAENLREHKVEKDRAIELAKSFYGELKSDSATAALKVRNRLRQENALRYLIKYYADSSLTNVPKAFAINFEYGINFRTPSLFEPKMAMLEQLKNSGSLRYFKNDELQQLIGDLTVAIKNVNDRQDIETTVRMTWLNPILADHHDFIFWSAITKDATIKFDKALEIYEQSDTIIPFHLRQVEKINREETTGRLAFYLYNVINSTRQTHIQRYMDVNAQLLSVLRREYDLK